MKIKYFVFAICTIALGAFIFSCGDSGKWVAKVGKENVTLDSFNSWYYTQNKQLYGDATNADIDKRAANPEEAGRNPLLDKRSFLENIISQKLIYKKAADDGYLKDKELNLLLDMARESFVVQYYVTKKYKEQIAVSDEEIGKIYTEQKARFKNAPIEQAEQYIRQNLMQQKLQVKFRDLVETLKEEGGIKRNLELIGLKKEEAQKADKPAVKEEPKK